MICVVGSKDGPFHFLEGRPEKTRFFCESDPDNVFYNEMCGHKWMLDNIDSLMAEPFLGLEHYRRAFDYSLRDICEALAGGTHGKVGTIQGPTRRRKGRELLKGR